MCVLGGVVVVEIEIDMREKGTSAWHVQLQPMTPPPTMKTM